MSGTAASKHQSQLVARSNSNSPSSRHTEHYFRIYDRILAAQYIRLQKKKQMYRLNPAPGKFLPRMDLYDDGSSPRISALLELPGVKYENINLRIHEGRLLVQGHRGAPLSSRLALNTPSYQSSSSHPTYTPNHIGVVPSPTSPTSPHTSIATGHAHATTNATTLAMTTTNPNAGEIDPVNYMVRELKFGTFRREITMPPGVEAREIKAELSEGMLLLSWPRYSATGATDSSQSLVDSHSNHTHNHTAMPTHT